MRLLLVNIYPRQTMAPYLLSSYVLKAYLEENPPAPEGLSVEVLDLPAQTPAPDLAGQILARSPDWVGYSCYVWNMGLITEAVRRLAQDKGPVQILGGPEISSKTIASLAGQGIGDYYVVGQGEERLAKLARHLLESNNGRQAALPGGVFGSGRGATGDEQGEEPLDLSCLPSVYLTGALPERVYCRGQAFLETQRGCRHKCAYCVYHKMLPRVSYFPLDRILKELDHLIVRGQVFALRILDAEFSSDLDRAKQIVRRLIELKGLKGVRLPWLYWEFTYPSVDEEFLELTAALKYRDRILNSGDIQPLDRPQVYSDLVKDYTAINCVGLQSFQPQALKAVRRARVNRDRFERFMKMVRDKNLVLKLDLILGLPNETFDSFFEGLEYLLPFLEASDHALNIHRLEVLPGSDLEQRSASYGLDCSGNSGHLVESTETMSRAQMGRASKLAAVLYRAVNSPLRPLFFKAWRQSGLGLAGYLERLLEALIQAEETAGGPLTRDRVLDEGYWTEAMFSDVRSRLMEKILSDR
ncbi:MAG: cobalamin-dependent protein [Deltaproteobacteria bacterium]|nr:cobalamin-dependent protein [Deltaproteobacteria bacterium]